MTWDELFRRIGEGVFLIGAGIGGLILLMFTIAIIIHLINRK